MSLDDRTRQSLDTALEGLRDRLTAELSAAESERAAAAAEERAAAIEAAREAARREADAEVARRTAEAEARLQATLDTALATARAEERQASAAEVRRIVEAETRQHLDEELAAAEQRLQAVLADAEARAAAQVRESVTVAKVEERESELAGVTRLLESIRGLDGATSLSEVLDALGQAVSRETARSAVVVLKGDRVVGWRLAGFGPRDPQPKSVDMPLDKAGVIGLAVGAARPVTSRDSLTAAAGPGFAHLPEDRMGLAVPVIVGGRVVAVVYGDSVAEGPRGYQAPSGWPEVLEILARHAARCLEALTAQKALSSPSPRFWVSPAAGRAGDDAPAAPAPVPEPPAGLARRAEGTGSEDAARRLARLLLSEIRLYNGPAVDEGRERKNLLSRLAPELERARQAYDATVPASLGTRAELFQQELIQTLAGGDGSLLGAPA
ncbi:MAG: GAF domain-containing protein [Vicinamibacterales bacterium]